MVLWKITIKKQLQTDKRLLRFVILTKFLRCSTASSMISWWPKVFTPRCSKSSARRFKSWWPVTPLFKNDAAYFKITLSKPAKRIMPVYNGWTIRINGNIIHVIQWQCKKRAWLNVGIVHLKRTHEKEDAFNGCPLSDYNARVTCALE